MKTSTVRKASVALAAAVALIFVAAAALADYPSIISSFRMSGVTPPYARGIYGGSSGVGGIFYEGPGRHSFRVFTSGGSLVATYPMPGGVMLGDADNPPQGYPSGAFMVVDEGARDVKVYNSSGSFLGVWKAVPPNTVGCAVGGYMEKLIYLGTSDGVVSVHTYSGSFITSFATGVPLADLGSAAGYRGWGEYMYLGPARSGDPVRVYNWGSICGTFHLPGLRNAGTVMPHAGGSIWSWCLRNTGTEIWAFRVQIGYMMPVEPASLGRIKALYK
jgi:hypothetical protein